jgi:hypothetical protein
MDTAGRQELSLNLVTIYFSKEKAENRQIVILDGIVNGVKAATSRGESNPLFQKIFDNFETARSRQRVVSPVFKIGGKSCFDNELYALQIPRSSGNE